MIFDSTLLKIRTVLQDVWFEISKIFTLLFTQSFPEADQIQSMSKESFLLTLLMYRVNKSFIGVAGLFANLSSELLPPAEEFAFQFGFQRGKQCLTLSQTITINTNISQVT